MLTAAGGALGVLSGWVLAFGVTTFTPLPARITLWSVVARAGASGRAPGTSSASIPPRGPSRLDPDRRAPGGVSR